MMITEFSSSIKVERTQSPKSRPVAKLGFGVYFTDHIFVCDYTRSTGWQSAGIIPYEKFQIDPSASALHYGQALFEGMKAFKQTNGEIVLFRPQFNFHRMRAGAERLCMEMPSEKIFIEGIKALVRTDQDWIPTKRGSSLYLRPTLIGTEAFLGVRPSNEYRFFVIASPVSAYYEEGFGPVKIWVEERDVRAAPGGLGATKAAANYAGSLRAAYEAKQKGFSQVLWLDVTHQYVEEVGTMNVFFMIGGVAHTPSLDGTILAGGVRDVVIQLFKDAGVEVIERKIKWSEVTDAFRTGQLTEAFGTGTAAVISPIGEFTRGNEVFKLGGVSGGGGASSLSDSFPVAQKLFNQITKIQLGEEPDSHSWLVEVR